MLLNIWDYCIFALCPSSGTLKKLSLEYWTVDKDQKLSNPE